MPKYITVTLTEHQCYYLIHALWMDIDNKRDADAPDNAFIIRIANKITKSLAHTKQS